MGEGPLVARRALSGASTMAATPREVGFGFGFEFRFGFAFVFMFVSVARQHRRKRLMHFKRGGERDTSWFG